jgi:metallophosphoesterase (TIGR03768 family)
MKKTWIYSLLIVGTLFIVSRCSSENDNNPAELKIHTTLDRTVVPIAVPSENVVAIDDPANYSKNGFGLWEYGSGIPYDIRLDLMPQSYNNSAVSKSASLIRFFTISDIHLTDKESPAQAIFFRNDIHLGKNSISLYSPLMLYTTHVLDAAVHTINELHKNNPIDFGLALGDLGNSSQYNELRWFIDILDGKKINPDSGDDDDPITGPNNDYQDEFQAAGLDQNIPWYAAIGNHDHFWIGSKTINDRLKASMIGENILQTGNILTEADAMDKMTYSNGTMDGRTLYGTIIGEGIVAEMGNIPTVPKDANRKAITKADFISELSITSTEPVGHGFIQSNPDNVFNGCYSFEPKADLPIKVIVLDNTMDNNDSPAPDGIYGHGTLNNGRYDWLMAQLNAGQDEGKLMIIAAHVPIGVAIGTPMDWIPAAGYTSEADLIRQLKAFPNLILWVSGHRHLNTVTAFKSDDASHPENGFWEVETKSLREFPQQFRTFDIMRNSDNTLSILATNVDPDIEKGSFAEISRQYAIASAQILELIEPEPGTGPATYNAELIVPLSPEMQVKIENYSKPINIDKQ